MALTCKHAVSMDTATCAYLGCTMHVVCSVGATHIGCLYLRTHCPDIAAMSVTPLDTRLLQCLWLRGHPLCWRIVPASWNRQLRGVATAMQSFAPVVVAYLLGCCDSLRRCGGLSPGGGVLPHLWFGARTVVVACGACWWALAPVVVLSHLVVCLRRVM